MAETDDQVRALVVTLSNIGDLVMTTPVLETLAELYPSMIIDVLADARASSLLHAAPYVGRIHHRNKRAGYRVQWRLLQSLREQRYALVVDLRTRIIPYLLRADLRLLKSARRQPDQHAVEEHYTALHSLVGDRPPPPCRLYLEPSAVITAAELLQPLPGTRWLALAPGANWPGKRWPVVRYRELVDLLGTRFDAVVVLGGRGDNDAELPLADIGLPVLDLVERTDLPTAAAVLARATAFVGNDSGLGHMAAALSIPTLTVFGPGQPARYRPWGRCSDIVMAPAADLAQLSAAQVSAALSRLLDAS